MKNRWWCLSGIKGRFIILLVFFFGELRKRREKRESGNPAPRASAVDTAQFSRRHLTDSVGAALSQPRHSNPHSSGTVSRKSRKTRPHARAFHAPADRSRCGSLPRSPCPVSAAAGSPPSPRTARERACHIAGVGRAAFCAKRAPSCSERRPLF